MAIALGLSGLRNVDVVRASTALLPSLRDEINETVLLAIWSSQGPVVFALEESRRPVSMNIRVGSILPILSTASGRVFAAFMPHDAVSALIDTELRRSQRFADPGILEEARKRGLASIEGTLVPGVNAVAVPVFDHKNRIAGVYWSARPNGRAGRRLRQQGCPRADAHSCRVSRRMGREP